MKSITAAQALAVLAFTSKAFASSPDDVEVEKHATVSIVTAVTETETEIVPFITYNCPTAAMSVQDDGTHTTAAAITGAFVPTPDRYCSRILKITTATDASVSSALESCTAMFYSATNGAPLPTLPAQPGASITARHNIPAITPPPGTIEYTPTTVTRTATDVFITPETTVPVVIPGHTSVAVEIQVWPKTDSLVRFPDTKSLPPSVRTIVNGELQPTATSEPQKQKSESQRSLVQSALCVVVAMIFAGMCLL